MEETRNYRKHFRIAGALALIASLIIGLVSSANVYAALPYSAFAYTPDSSTWTPSNSSVERYLKGAYRYYLTRANGKQTIHFNGQAKIFSNQNLGVTVHAVLKKGTSWDSGTTLKSGSKTFTFTSGASGTASYYNYIGTADESYDYTFAQSSTAGSQSFVYGVYRGSEQNLTTKTFTVAYPGSKKIYFHANGGTVTDGYSYESDAGTRYIRIGSDEKIEYSDDNGGTWGDISQWMYSDNAYGTSSGISYTATGLNLFNYTTFGLTRAGYHVDSTAEWNTAADGSGNDINQETTATTDTNAATWARVDGTVLYVNWKPDTYTLTRHYNGGDGTDGTVSGGVTTAATTNNTLDVPTRENRNFLGWADADGVMVYDADGNAIDGTYWSGSGSSAVYQGAKDLEVYAQWSGELTYTVSYDANGGTGAPASQTKNAGAAISISGTEPTRTGYIFSSWNTAADGTGTSYTSGQSYSADADLALYAQWTETYAVTYNANGGSGAPASQTKVNGVNLTLSSEHPTRSGYVFKNWNTASNGSGTTYTPGQTYTGNAALTLYAQWYSTYTVSYDANGGENAPDAQTKVEGTALTLSATEPTRYGYTFANWNTASDGTGTDYAPGALYTANAAVTLYAQWDNNVYAIVLHGNGGTLNGSDLCYVSMDCTDSNTVAVAARADCKFLGYNTAADGSGEMVYTSTGAANNASEYWNANKWAYGDLESYEMIDLYAIWEAYQPEMGMRVIFSVGSSADAKGSKASDVSSTDYGDLANSAGEGYQYEVFQGSVPDGSTSTEKALRTGARYHTRSLANKTGAVGYQFVGVTGLADYIEALTE